MGTFNQDTPRNSADPLLLLVYRKLHQRKQLYLWAMFQNWTYLLTSDRTASVGLNRPRKVLHLIGMAIFLFKSLCVVVTEIFWFWLIFRRLFCGFSYNANKTFYLTSSLILEYPSLSLSTNFLSILLRADWVMVCSDISY